MPATDRTRTKLLLGKVYASQFVKDIPQLEYLERAFFTDRASLERELNELRERGFIQSKSGTVSLTEKGRSMITVVMTGGSFDIIHPGHIDTLEQASELGHALIVSVARDSTFFRNKKRRPEHDEKLRRNLVSSLRMVDAAVLGSETDIFETVLLLKPDIIALGYDQFHSEAKIIEELAKRGLKISVVRLKSYSPDIKSSSILSRGDPSSLRDL